MKITIGLSLSLSGEYTAMGGQAEAALRLFVTDANSSDALRVGGERCEFALDCRDDAGDPARCAEIYRELCAPGRTDIIFGPYSNRLARVAAPIVEDARRVFVNHGGAGDELHESGYRMQVSVLSPASDYMRGLVRMLATLKLWRKRLALVTEPARFARAVAAGVEHECRQRAIRRRGVRIRVKWNSAFDPALSPARLFPALRRNRVNALVSSGSYAHDVAVMRAVAASPLSIPVLGCVAAGVRRFGEDLDEHAAGIVGPSQWEDTLELDPELGPTPREFARRMRAAGAANSPDYPAAQAYAAGLLTAAAISSAGSLDQHAIRSAFSDLRTSTMYGDFAIDRVTGRQVGHQLLLVQWHAGRKVVIEPQAHANVGTLELPSGWSLILAGVDMLKLNRRDRAADSPEEKEEDPDQHDRDQN